MPKNWCFKTKIYFSAFIQYTQIKIAGVKAIIKLTPALNVFFSDYTMVSVGGFLIQMSVYKNEMWGISRFSVLYKVTVSFNSISGWTNIGDGYIWVSIGPTQVWALALDNQIYTCMNPCNGGFNKISGLLTQVSLGMGVAWGITLTSTVFSSSVPFINWNEMDGNAANISVSQNYVFTLTMGGEVHRCPLPCSPGTTPTVLTGTYFQMSGMISFHINIWTTNGSMLQTFHLNSYTL